MKTLILMRHAKSDWSVPGQDDFDRTLNARGRRSAEAIGKWLGGVRQYLPELVLVSSARRTVETWEGVQKALPEAEVRPLPALYHASAGAMLDLLRAQGGTSDVVMMIGHNPGIGAFARSLASGKLPSSELDRYPTSATTVFTIDDDSWKSIGAGVTKVQDFVLARDLTD